jgi:hypothetical protein
MCSLSFKIKFLRLYIQAFIKMTKISLLKRESQEMNQFEELAIDCMESVREVEKLLERYVGNLQGQVLIRRPAQNLDDEIQSRPLNARFELDCLYSSYIECLLYVGLVLRSHDEQAAAMTYLTRAQAVSLRLCTVTNNFRLVGKCVLLLLHLSAIHIEGGEYAKSMVLLNQSLDLSLSQLISLKRHQLKVLDPHSKKLGYEMGKCCHLLLVGLLQMIYNYEMQKKPARLFETLNFADWFITNHMPQNELFKIFNKAVSELQGKYEYSLRLEHEYSELAQLYFEAYMPLLSAAHRAAAHEERAFIDSKRMNHFLYEHFGHGSYNAQSTIASLHPALPAPDREPTSPHFPVPKIDRADLAVFLHNEKNNITSHSISLDDLVPDDVYNLNMTFDTDQETRERKEYAVKRDQEAAPPS